MSLPRYPAYKDSGVSWLGEVPAHWDVCRLKSKLSLRTEKAERRIFPVALENIEGWTGRYLETETEFQGEGVSFDSGDILFGKLRPYLAKVLLAQCAGEAVGDFHVLRPSNDIVGRYAQYQMLARNFIDFVNGETFGSKMPRASWDSLGGMPFVSPSPSEQVKIATFLDRETAKIDALIAEQEKLIALLAEKRQATISRAVTRGLDPNVLLKDSGVPWLGKVPVHWEVLPLKRLFADVKAGPFGSALTKDMYQKQGYRVYGQEQVIPADFSIGDYYISAEKYAELKQYAVEPGDVLISCVGTFGKIAVVPDDVEPGVINPRLIRLKVGASVNNEYLAAVLKSSVVFDQFAMVSRGGTMDTINIGTLSSIVLAVPPIAEQPQLLSFIAQETKRLNSLCEKAEQAIALLKERRAALISAAVTGKMDVRGLAA